MDATEHKDYMTIQSDVEAFTIKTDQGIERMWVDFEAVRVGDEWKASKVTALRWTNSDGSFHDLCVFEFSINRLGDYGAIMEWLESFPFESYIEKAVESLKEERPDYQYDLAKEG